MFNNMYITIYVFTIIYKDYITSFVRNENK